MGSGAHLVRSVTSGEGGGSGAKWVYFIAGESISCLSPGQEPSAAFQESMLGSSPAPSERSRRTNNCLGAMLHPK